MPPKSQRFSQSQASQSSQSISSGDLQQLARSAVRYLLMNDHTKVPIRHSDLVKNVTKNATKNAGLVVQLATKMLREVYGIRLIDDGLPNKHYLLINDLKEQNHMDMAEETKSEMTLLAIILSFIFMQTNGRWTDAGVDQQKLFNFLATLDIDHTGNHEYFGEVKKKLETFKSQRYLDLVRIENTDPIKYEYHWGLRAIEEVSPRDALTFASEMYGRDNVESWAAHYKAVTEYEKKHSARS